MLSRALVNHSNKKYTCPEQVEFPLFGTIETLDLSHNNYDCYKFFFSYNCNINTIDLSFNQFEIFTFSTKYRYPKTLNLSQNVKLKRICGKLIRTCDKIVLKNCPNLKEISPDVLSEKIVIVDNPFDPKLISGLWNCTKINDIPNFLYRKKARIFLLKQGLREGHMKFLNHPIISQLENKISKLS